MRAVEELLRNLLIIDGPFVILWAPSGLHSNFVYMV